MCLVVSHIGFLHQFGTVMLLDIFGSLNDETCRAHRRVADFPIDLWLHQFNHHADDVTWSTELTIIAGSSHLAKYILIDVAHCIAIGHVQVLDTFHHFNKGTRILNHEDSGLHIATVGRLLTFPKALNEDENIVTDNGEHLGRFLVSEVLPTKVTIWNVTVSFRVVPEGVFLKDQVVGVDTKDAGIGFFLILRIIQHLHKEEVGHLLQYGHRVGDAASPKGIPNLVDSIFDFACYHMVYFVFVCKGNMRVCRVFAQIKNSGTNFLCRILFVRDSLL